MSDIHIGISSLDGDRRVLTVYFHIPITEPKYPGGQVSEIASSLDQDEIDALAGGTLYEHKTSFKKHESESKADAGERLKPIYLTTKAKIQSQIQENYKFYGDKIEVE